ncbi:MULTISPECIES: phospho-sugar mutase [Staphylococcus]|uniref:Phosphoglucomutase n=1 Tax=Staphylococcus hsinchuensis TaxID=3051183 RepID=A0ABZ3EBD7_9STAP|nr:MULTISPECIES: phospho-sugar mutase [unclassified Staphylococcus]
MKQQWLDKIDESLVKSFYDQQSENEQHEGFENILSFGTAGIRSKIGLGPGYLNAFTVRKVALGLAKYLKAQTDEPKAVIYYDTRLLSDEFSVEMASVMGTFGVQVILANSYKSTPELSFAVKHLKADAGVMITASHNPKQYNGIKVYNEKGGQLLPDTSEALSEYINNIKEPLTIEKGNFNALVDENAIVFINQDLIEEYKQEVKDLVGTIEGNETQVVLTSLHGTSLPILSEILDELDFNQYVIEDTQSKPDGNFPTVKAANPEEEAVFERSLKLAEERDAQLIIATDPDADRLGFIERYGNNDYKYFNGNEIGLLLMKLRFQVLVDEGKPLYIVKSIVTSELADRLAHALDVEVNNVLTGFKFISDKIEEKESDGKDQLLLAFEESHGYLAKPISRDKDAIQIAPLLIKYKNLLAKNGLTFKDEMNDIYQNIGKFENRTLAPEFEGEAGRSKIVNIMERFRNEPQTQICGIDVKQIEDYQKGSVKNLETGETESLTLPNTNLVRFIFDDGFIALRPSGTEPKLKVYFSLKAENIDEITDQFMKEYIETV